MNEDIRWKQRFHNFEKALATLHEAINALKQEPDNHLYEIALIGTFKFTFELGWKTLKDYLKYGSINVNLPREVIKQSYNTGLLLMARHGLIY